MVFRNGGKFPSAATGRAPLPRRREARAPFRDTSGRSGACGHGTLPPLVTCADLVSALARTADALPRSGDLQRRCAALLAQVADHDGMSALLRDRDQTVRGGRVA